MHTIYNTYISYTHIYSGVDGGLVAKSCPTL